MMRNLLEFMGIDPLRLRISWVSASEGKKFADVISEVTKDIKNIGPQEFFRREAV